MSRRLLNVVKIAGLAAMSFAIAAQTNYVPSNGYVPDPATAVQIAEAVLIPVYGRATIDVERPFRATLKQGVWTVSGTLNCTNCDGGVAIVRLAKADGRVLSMIHGK